MLAHVRRVVASGCVAVLAAAVGVTAASGAEGDEATVTADYGTDAGGFDPGKYLNGNEGGYRTHDSLNWLPESYDEFAEAGLQLVTVTHLLNENFYNVVSGTPPDLGFDYSKLDRVVLPLLDEGLTPVMGVAFTPAALGGASEDVGYSPAIPNDNDAWRLVVEDLVRHYRDLGYTGWYWEVWNEPSLDVFWDGTQAEYNAMYRATAEGVKAADPTAQVGGPATNAPNLDWTAEFIDYIGDHPSVPLDFVSFHEYGDVGGDFDISGTKQALDANGLGDTPIFITEWNSTFDMTGGAGSRPDTNAGASYAVRTLSKGIAKPELAKVFFFSPKEGFTPTKLFNGDLGLLTVDGHRKAVFNAHELWGMLGPRVLSMSASGAGTDDGAVGAVATKDPATGEVTVVAWNDQASGATLQLDLTALPYTGRNVRVTQYLVDESHANYYGDYAAGVRGWDVGPNENLDPVESRVVPGRATFSRTLSLGASSVVGYVLEPTAHPVTEAAQVGPAPVPVGSRDLAFGRPVMSSSSLERWTWRRTALTDGLEHSFPRADGGEGVSGWSSDGHAGPEATEWAYVDLGRPSALDEVRLLPRDDRHCEGYGFPVDFTIAGANDPDGPWRTLVERTDYRGGEPLTAPVSAQAFDVTGTYRYVRVRGTELQRGCAGTGDDDHYLQLAELQVFSTKDLAARARVSTTPEAVTVSMQDTERLSRVDLHPLPGGAGFPSDFTVQLAADDACSTWKTVVTKTDHPNPGKFRRTFGFPAQDARCVRVRATGSPDGSGPIRLRDVRLYH